jgi:hypothetical protein
MKQQEIETVEDFIEKSKRIAGVVQGLIDLNILDDNFIASDALNEFHKSMKRLRSIIDEQNARTTQEGVNKSF